MSTPMRVALIGWGAIGQYVGAELRNTDVELVAVGVSDARSERVGIPSGTLVIEDPAQLADLRPDVVAEAAGRSSVAPWGRAALDAGAEFIVSSTSAFADPAVLDELRRLALTGAGQIQIQPGALGGVDALAAAAPMGLHRVEHRIIKPPRAWKHTPAEQLCELSSLREPTVFFTGNSTETANAFPKNANVAMTTALAGIGPERTRISLVADPAATTNRHEISASGNFGDLEVAIANNPLPGNPKSSAMAALNLVRAIMKRTAAIQI